MPVEIEQLDKLQQDYKAAVSAWVAAIRHEEELASISDHSVADLDQWEEADGHEDELREAAKDAKSIYEDALREKFFHF